MRYLPRCYKRNANECGNRSYGFFLEFRDRLHNLYSEVFRGGGGEDEFSIAAQFSRKWSWYSTIDQLSGSDITKYETIEEMDMHTCLYNLCFKIDKNKFEVDQIKQQTKR